MNFEEIFHVFISGSFTPNGDGLNDVFFPKGVGINPKEEYEFRIFDRDGEKIFESFDLENGWDGRYKNTSTIVLKGNYV